MNDYSFVATHVPCNKTAANCVRKGFHYQFESKVRDKYHSENPLKTIKNISDFSSEDFTGKKHGFFTVIGLTKRIDKSGFIWLVKCRCGIYEVRTSKSIRNHRDNPGKYDPDMCLACADIEKIKKMASAKSIGIPYKEYCEKTCPRRNDK